jgi:hypothetical protein
MFELYVSITMKFVITAETTGGINLNAMTSLAHQMGKLVHQYLQKNQYGLGVMKFHLVLKLLVPEQAAAFPPGQFYRPRKKEVLFAPLVDIQQAIEASENEWKEMVCKEILIAVSRLQELGVKNFDREAFQEDLVKFFHQNGWIN